MNTWNEEEDGMGCAGLVPSRAEREHDKALTNAYAEGRRDEQEELASVLPGSYYMDPPDGGSVTVLEQFTRMAQDAAKWREYISSPLPTSERFSVTRHHLCGNLAGCYTAPQLCDACLNAAGN